MKTSKQGFCCHGPKCRAGRIPASKVVFCPRCLAFSYCSQACMAADAQAHVEHCLDLGNANFSQYLKTTTILCPLDARFPNHIHGGNLVPGRSESIEQGVEIMYDYLSLLPPHPEYAFSCRCAHQLSKHGPVDAHCTQLLLTPMGNGYGVLVGIACLKCPPVARANAKHLFIMQWCRSLGDTALCFIPFQHGLKKGSRLDKSLLRLLNVSSPLLAAPPVGFTPTIQIAKNPTRAGCKCFIEHYDWTVTADIYGEPIFGIIDNEWSMDI